MFGQKALNYIPPSRACAKFLILVYSYSKFSQVIKAGNYTYKRLMNASEHTTFLPSPLVQLLSIQYVDQFSPVDSRVSGSIFCMCNSLL